MKHLRDFLLLMLIFCMTAKADIKEPNFFEGKYYYGEGDVEYIELLDISRRMFDPDPEFQNITMLYEPTWNGFVEGFEWGAYWIQNSYGTTYCAMPFLFEPYLTFLQNSHDLWFNKMGDGETEYTFREFTWIPPDGCLMDAANKEEAFHKQGDGLVELHDWPMESTAAGALMQAELLLISRNFNAIDHYLPMIERCANFIETRRDPLTNLFLSGAASNLLAPSYAGWKKSDGTFGMASLSGLSITYIALLDRIIELQKIIGNSEKLNLYTKRRNLAREGLPLITTEEGYFIKSLDPDGTKHGVFGAKKHGYFESVCNHDAICFRVVDNEQAEKIYEKISSIHGLRPYDFIITNFPYLDDTYMPFRHWLWEYGIWVDGASWATCEARMIMSYYRLGKYEDVRRSMNRLVSFAKSFRLDSPFVNFGSGVFSPFSPINLTYDCFGPPAAMIRGLFEYEYKAEGLNLIPHIPSGINYLEQKFPIRFGKKKLYLSTSGIGPVTDVIINDVHWDLFDTESIFLPYDKIPDRAIIQIIKGGEKVRNFIPPESSYELSPIRPLNENLKDISPSLSSLLLNLREKYYRLVNEGLSNSYEASHVKIAYEFVETTNLRFDLIEAGKIKPLQQISQILADESYLFTIDNLIEKIEFSPAIVEDQNLTNNSPELMLFQNHPNPFNSKTNISFSVDYSAKIKFQIYNYLGQSIRTYNLSNVLPGKYSVYWDGKDSFGEEVASGFYICSISTEKHTKAIKMFLIK